MLVEAIHDSKVRELVEVFERVKEVPAFSYMLFSLRLTSSTAVHGLVVGLCKSSAQLVLKPN